MSIRLSRGALIQVDGELCEVRRRFGDRVEIQEFRTGRVSTPTEAELDEMFVDDRVAFPPDPAGGGAGGGAAAGAPDLAALPEKTRLELERRLTYVRPFLALPAVRRTADRAAEFLAGYPEVDDRHGRSWTRPKPRTLLLWCQSYGRGGPGSLLALAPKHWRSGRPFPPEDEPVEAVIAEVLRETLMRPERPTIAFAYDRIVNRITSMNKVRKPANQLREPSRARVYRRVKILVDPYELAKAREGKRAADRQFGGVRRGARASRPLERVIMDHTVLDVVAVDDRERPLFVGRPTLTVLIDVFSRCVLGFFLSFEPPSFAQSAIALRRAILPKVRLNPAGPAVKHPWPCSGVMEKLVVDNGKDFHSEPFRAACALLGIELAYAPIRKPEAKAIGERFFGTLNTRGVHCIPGTTKSNPRDRGEYRSADEARFTLPELDALLTKIIVDDYHQAIHSGLERPPAAVYAEGMREAVPAPLKDARELRIALGIPETRQIRPEGIVHERLWYTEGLDGLRRRLGNGAEVEIRVDPLDIGRIQVLDPEERRFVEVGVEPARRADACGLPLFSHQRIRGEVRRKGLNEHDREEYARTREEIWQAMRGKDGRRRPGRGPWARSGNGGMRRVRAAGGLGTAQLDVLDRPAPDRTPEASGTARPVAAAEVDRPPQAPARPAAGNAGPAPSRASKDARDGAAREGSDPGETARPPSVEPVAARAGPVPHAPAWRVVKH